MNEKLKAIAPNLLEEHPRSPREKLGGYVVAGRTLDKCRAMLAGTAGEYHFDCPLDQLFLNFIGVSAEDFKEKAASGADDHEMAEWIKSGAGNQEKSAIVEWNNDLLYKRISEMPIDLQVFLEDYIPECLPDGARITYWFDIYDIEEGRMQA